MKRKKKIVVNEVCTCGHLKNQHMPSFIMNVQTLEIKKGNDQGRKTQPIAQGHGACNVMDCECGKFTWKGFIYKA